MHCWHTLALRLCKTEITGSVNKKLIVINWCTLGICVHCTLGVHTHPRLLFRERTQVNWKSYLWIASFWTNCHVITSINLPAFTLPSRMWWVNCSYPRAHTNWQRNNNEQTKTMCSDYNIILCLLRIVQMTNWTWRHFSSTTSYIHNNNTRCTLLLSSNLCFVSWLQSILHTITASSNIPNYKTSCENIKLDFPTCSHFFVNTVV